MVSFNRTINNLDPNKTWASSDYHFFHDNVLKYDGRPFKDSNEMKEGIVKNHNLAVAPDDIVIFHGDLAFTKVPEEAIEVVESMNGAFFFIAGNHDRILKSRPFLNKFGDRINDTLSLIFDLPENRKVKCFCSHYKHSVWPASHMGSIHTFGHTHGKIPQAYMYDRSMDVGIMEKGYYPFLYSDIIQELTNKPIGPIDTKILERGRGK